MYDNKKNSEGIIFSKKILNTFKTFVKILKIQLKKFKIDIKYEILYKMFKIYDDRYSFVSCQTFTILVVNIREKGSFRFNKKNLISFYHAHNLLFKTVFYYDYSTNVSD